MPVTLLTGIASITYAADRAARAADACLINTCFKACGMLNAYAASKK